MRRLTFWSPQTSAGTSSSSVPTRRQFGRSLGSLDVNSILYVSAPSSLLTNCYCGQYVRFSLACPSRNWLICHFYTRHRRTGQVGSIAFPIKRTFSSTHSIGAVAMGIIVSLIRATFHLSISHIRSNSTISCHAVVCYMYRRGRYHRLTLNAVGLFVCLAKGAFGSPLTRK